MLLKLNTDIYNSKSNSCQRSSQCSLRPLRLLPGSGPKELRRARTLALSDEQSRDRCRLRRQQHCD